MSRIIGGMPVGVDGRVRTTFCHNPSNLRLSSQRPNLQNIPRTSGDEVARWVKEIFVAPVGYLLYELDYSAIEAVLVGYFAGDPNYIRFAKLGVHAYLASHLLHRPADLSWTDSDLKSYFKQLKQTEGPTYDIAKRVVHLSNYRGTPTKMHQEYPETFRTRKDAEKLQGIYFDLFPSIPQWHLNLCERVDGAKRRRRGEQDEAVDPWTLGVCYAQNPFGYRHEFYNVLDWTHTELPDGSKLWHSALGDDAKRLISFLPSSTASAILKRAAKRVFVDYPDIGANLRLLVHDSIVGEAAERDVERDVGVIHELMTRPIPQLPLDPSWQMGEYLSINAEVKVGPSWADMRTL